MNYYHIRYQLLSSLLKESKTPAEKESEKSIEQYKPMGLSIGFLWVSGVPISGLVPTAGSY